MFTHSLKIRGGNSKECFLSRLFKASFRTKRFIYSIVLSIPAVVPKIQDYAVIGDCRAAALVSRYGSLDWLCWPRFDSTAIFSALLDQEKGGHWSITPASSCRFERAY